jgi:FkbM family methyltransferase
MLEKTKEFIESHILLKIIIKPIFKLTMYPFRYFMKRRSDAFMNKCFVKYAEGDRIIKSNFGGHSVCYYAISPKNYWHTTIGSQHEDRFAQLLFTKCINLGSTVLDIGGHTGLYTVPFSKAVGEAGRVIVFEPESKGYEAIKKNLELNNVTNCYVENAAVSDEEKEITFYIRPDKDTHSMFENSTSPSPTGILEKIVIPALSIDNYLIDKNVPKISLVKIDTEGGELKVLKGMKKTAAKVDYILVEIHAEELKLQGIEDPNKAVELELMSIGFGKFEYLDAIHILASK